VNHSPLRRRLLGGLLLLPVLPRFAFAASSTPQDLHAQLAALESASHGRLGVALYTPQLDRRLSYRADERFAFCSTAKVMAVAAILQRSISQPALLQQLVQFSQQQVSDSGYAPITAQHLGDGMTISALCAAALSYSDNAAMNLLLHTLSTPQQSGPLAVTAYARTLGDRIFRLDRSEPSLNTAIPGDKRDTSTPSAMAASLQHLLHGDHLPLPQRTLLKQWMLDNTTGGKRIRAGVDGWQVGDKTGTGAYGTTNDLAFLQSLQGGEELVLAIYFTQEKQDAAPRDEVIAAATRIVMAGYARFRQGSA
jgi:beta-lactamase class A